MKRTTLRYPLPALSLVWVAGFAWDGARTKVIVSAIGPLCAMFAAKHGAGGFGTLRTLPRDKGKSRGPLSLHTAIGVERTRSCLSSIGRPRDEERPDFSPHDDSDFGILPRLDEEFFQALAEEITARGGANASDGRQRPSICPDLAS